MKVIDYSLIESDDHGELVEAVATTCRDHGWVPCGNVCVWFEPVRIVASNQKNFVETAGGVVHYAQALVKYGE